MPSTHRPPRWRGLAMLGLLAWAGLLLGHPAGAADFTVTSTADDGSPGTLRAAIGASEASTDAADSIVIMVTGTITLTQSELDIFNGQNVAGKTLFIAGPGADRLTVSGNNQSEVFDIYNNSAGDITVNISGLTVTAGSESDGGGIYNDSGQTLTLTDCAIVGNVADYGGGIYNDGVALSLTRCTVSGNITYDDEGGGIYSDSGTLTLTDCTLENNISEDDGGAIYSDGGPAVLSGCTVRGNISLYYRGGGIYNGSDTLDLTNCTITGNAAYDDDGGGIYNDGGAMTLTGCTVSGNAAYSGDSGGGIYSSGQPLALTNCLISGNLATSEGGGLYLSGGGLSMAGCTVSGNTAGGQGGGLYVSTNGIVPEDVRQAASRVTAPAVTPALGTVDLTNCTVSGNTSSSQGGGLYIALGTSGTASLTSCTVNANQTTNSTGGGVYFTGSNNGGDTDYCLVTASIIAGNTAAYSGLPTLARIPIPAGIRPQDVSTGGSSRPFSSGGSNIIGSDESEGAFGFTNDPDHANPDSLGNHDQVGTPDALIDPGLDPLQDNGGPTPTQALTAGSPARDADFTRFLLAGGVGVFVPLPQPTTEDQRGLPRPIGPRNDIGAYEHQPPTAQDDAYSAQKNNPLNVPAPGVLGNDAADGGSTPGALGTVLITNPAHGTVTLNTDGSFTYASFTGYTGPDSFAYQAFDAYGLRSNLATVRLTVGDTKAPYTTATVSDTRGSNDFYRSSVSVTLTPTDSEDTPGQLTTRYTTDGSAPTGTSPLYGGPIPFSGDGPHTLKFFSTDSQGNAETPQTLVVKIDTQLPAVQGNFTPAANGAGWNNTPVDFTYTATDNYSGVASATPGSPIHFMAEGPAVAQVTVADNAGNSGTVTQTGPRIDLTAPVTTVATQPVSSGQQVTLTATDNLSGVAGTTYAVDGGARTAYSAPFTVSGSGQHTVTFSSADVAGNTEAVRTLTFNTNSAAPHTTAALSGTQNADGSFAGPVTVTLSATSTNSTVTGTFYRLDGGAQTAYTAPFTVSGSGQHTVTFSSTDAAGDTEAANTVSFTITPAAPTTPGVLHTYPAGLQMLSAPEDYSNIPLSQTLSAANPKLAVWVPDLLQYVLTPTSPADALRSGQGYWARFAQSTDLYDTGTPTRTDQAFGISLHRGWNMIGDPFLSPVALNAARVLDGAGNSYTLTDANTAGLIFPTLYTFTAGSTQYTSVDASSGTLAPYQGYWIYALRGCTLSVPPPAAP